MRRFLAYTCSAFVATCAVADDASSGGRSPLDAAWIDGVEPVAIIVVVDSIPDEQLSELELGAVLGGAAFGGGVMAGSMLAVGHSPLAVAPAVMPAVMIGALTYMAFASGANAEEAQNALHMSAAARRMMTAVDAQVDWDELFVADLERDLDGLGMFERHGPTVLISRDRIERELRAARHGRQPPKDTVRRHLRDAVETALDTAYSQSTTGVLCIEYRRSMPHSTTGVFRIADVSLRSPTIAPRAYELAYVGKFERRVNRSWVDVDVYKNAFAAVTTPVDLSTLKSQPEDFRQELHERVDREIDSRAMDVRATKGPAIAALRLSELERERVRRHYLVDSTDEWDLDRIADYMDEKWRPEDPAYYRSLMERDTADFARGIVVDLGRLAPVGSIPRRRAR